MREAKKIGIITQARMTSTRLPGKVLIPVKGKPLIKYHVDRLKWSSLPVYIATTINQTDDPIVDFSIQENLKYFRGSEDNVLSRFYQCAKENQLDVIIRVTSDCPLIDGAIIKDALNEYLSEEDENLYLSNALVRNYPRGLDFEIFSYSLLEDAYNNAKESYQLEHVTPYINQNKSGKVRLKHYLYSSDESHIRITLDTPDDLLLIKKIIEEYDAGEKSGAEIINILKHYPELLKINSHIEQKKI